MENLATSLAVINSASQQEKRSTEKLSLLIKSAIFSVQLFTTLGQFSLLRLFKLPAAIKCVSLKLRHQPLPEMSAGVNIIEPSRKAANVEKGRRTHYLSVCVA